jgi:hypothetical protein
MSIKGMTGIGAALMQTMPEDQQDAMMKSVIQMKMCHPFFEFRSAYEASVETMILMGYTRERAETLMADITNDMEEKYKTLPTLKEGIERGLV